MRSVLPSRSPARVFLVLLIGAAGLSGCRAGSAEHTLVVTATAYNALPGQTSGDPQVTAWGDTLTAGMRAIAVSPDLVEAGLAPGTRVAIEGLEGTYVVRDKMADRWTRRIDIFMGRDIEAATAWGKRTVRIRWTDE